MKDEMREMKEEMKEAKAHPAKNLSSKKDSKKVETSKE